MFIRQHWTLMVSAALFVTACGGGGGSSSPSQPTAAAANNAPTIGSSNTASVREGSTAAITIETNDSDGQTVTVSLSGDDADLFSLSDGALSFVSAPDFEAPNSAAGTNTYSVTIGASDGTDTTNQSLTISVTDAFEGRVVDAPISGATVFVDLNGNGLRDSDEPTGATDANGFFYIETFTLIEGMTAKVVSKGGTDIKTGKALRGLALISDVPADLTKSAIVTPLTTVIAAVATPVAKAEVLAAMGITGTPEELLTSDGWAAAEGGNENAKAAQRLNQQVGLLLQTAATLTDDGDAETDVSIALAQAVAKQISKVAQLAGELNLSAKNTIQTVLIDAAAEATPDAVIETAIVSAISSSVSEFNAVVADTTIDPVSDTANELLAALQDSFQSSVTNVVAGTTSVADFATTTATSELFSDVTAALDAPDLDGDGISDALDSDDDGDGVQDSADAFSRDATETVDTDGDGIGNNADTDDDGDGVQDSADAFSRDATETVDTDGDGIGNNADTDDDGDGITDDKDTFPLVSNVQTAGAAGLEGFPIPEQVTVLETK